MIWLRNVGTTEAPEYAEPIKLTAGGKVLDVFGCPSPNFVDFDFDDDLDLICGEFLDGFTYFENVGSGRRPHYAAGQRLLAEDGRPLVMDVQMIVPVAFDWDGDEDADLIVGDEDGRVAFIENLSSRHAFKQARADGTHGPPQFRGPTYFQQRADKLKCGALATPVGVDWDADGDTDILAGNTAGRIEFFENLGVPAEEAAGKSSLPKWAAPVQLSAGGKPYRIMAGANLSVQGPAEAKWGYTTFSVADWNGDGTLDIVTNSIIGRVEWLKNVGTGTHPELASPEPIKVAWSTTTGGLRKPTWTWWTPNGGELVTQWRTTPVVYDFDADGWVDLAMLDTEGYLAFYKRERHGQELVLLPPQRRFHDADGRPLRLNDKSAGGSGRRKLSVVDWDGDGMLDLLVNSSNADLYRGLGRQADGSWRFERSGSLAEQNIEGHDVGPTTVDFDRDGIPDFLGGAEDGRFYYLRNPRSLPR